MAFTVDLNPKNSKSMDLMDLMKMEEYLGRKPAAKVNNMVKSSADDKGVEFRFNSNQNANDTTG
jgi:hypothetical protein